MAIQALPFTLFQQAGIETRNRSLRFDHNAMADFEQTTGMGLSRLMATSAVFAATRALLWAGLKHQDRGITIEFIGAKIQEYQDSGREINDLLKACLDACVKQKAIPGLKLTDNEEELSDPNGQPGTPTDSQTVGTSIVPGQVTSEP